MIGERFNACAEVTPVLDHQKCGRTRISEIGPEAAEAESGMPISAGARMVHIRMADESGRMFYVDLSGVPEDERPGVVAEIKALIERASVRPAG